MLLTLRHLTSRPSVRYKEGRLIAQTSLLSQLCRLGLFSRRLEINRDEQVIRFQHRWFGISSQEQVIPFSSVASISIEFQDLIDDWLMENVLESYTFRIRLLAGDYIEPINWIGNYHHPYLMSLFKVEADETSAPRTESEVFLTLSRYLMQDQIHEELPYG